MTGFDKPLALLCARASVAAYELDDTTRATLLATAALDEIGYIQGRQDARLLICQTHAGDIVYAFQGTQFGKREWSAIFANLNTTPVDIGAGRQVMTGYRDQLLDLLPWMNDLPPASIVTGHSLGGAVGSLYVGGDWTAFRPGIKLVTFGAPLCANAAFWNKSREVLHMRVEREKDPAPRWPLDSPYVQPGQVWWLHAGTVTLCDHRPTVVDMVLDWADHAPAKYPADLAALADV